MAWRSFGWVVPPGAAYEDGYVPEQDSSYYDDALECYEDLADYVAEINPAHDYAVELAATWQAMDNGEGSRFLLYVEPDGHATYEAVEPYAA